MFAFDERPETLLARLDGLGLEIRPSLESGLIAASD